MKAKILILIIFLCLTNVLQLWAYDFQVVGYYFNYIQGTNDVELTHGNGIDETYSGDIVIPNLISFYGSHRVTRISSSAFMNCFNLTSIFIPSNITTIGDSAFYGCSGLTVLSIPSNVTTMGEYLFEGCTNLKVLAVAWANPPAITNSTVYYISSYCKLIVPKNSLAAYQSAPIWQDFVIDTSYLLCGGDTHVYAYVQALQIRIYSNTQWTASPNTDWISLNTISNNSYTTLMAYILENDSVENRFATIAITSSDQDTCIIYITQYPVNSGKWEYVQSIGNIINNDQMNTVYAQGENNVYVVGTNGFIGKSTDKALTWTVQHFPNQETFNDITFCNDSVGFIVGNNGTILKTEDAGVNWTQVSSGATQNINAICATGLDNIWAVGNSGLIIQSTDTGENWIIRDYANNRNLYDVKFKNDTGYIAGDGNQIICVKNIEGLQPDWWLQSAYSNPKTYDKITTLNVTDNNVYALVNSGYGSSNVIYTSGNGNWSAVNMNNFYYTYGIIQIFFQSDYVSYVAYLPPIPTGSSSGGSSFALARTIDGGQTWDDQNLPYGWKMNGNRIELSFSKNNEYGYFVCGTVLLRTPYTGTIGGPTNIELNSKSANIPKIMLIQQGNYLHVSSTNTKVIESVEVISVAGIRLLKVVNGANVDLNNLSKGVYLIRVLFTDKTSETVKWIKNTD